MIPRIIHYCWFGRSEMPELERRCVEGWKTYLRGYEFRLLNEETFDINAIPYVHEAYEQGKYAFVSDVARLYALVNEGGVYLDTDVELLRPLDFFLDDDAFCGYENRTNIGTAVMGSVKGFSLFAQMLDYYQNNHFVLSKGVFDQTTNVQILSRLLDDEGYVRKNEETVVADLHLYERQVFYPKKQTDGTFDVKPDSVSIHHGSASWLTERERKRGENLVWRNVARPILRKVRDALNSSLGENRTREIEAALRKKMR